MSDSSYAAFTRHRQPNSTSGRLPSLEIVDDDWAADTLSDDDIDCHQQETKIQNMLGDLDVDAVVVATGHSDSAQNDSERRMRENNRWNDLALRFDGTVGGNGGENRNGTDNDNEQNQ
mmetsp:Transcript_3736/g.5588  ORF Transcript_3736/g.5588 Transcript_3736/m.5588 type:complete len:118 (-) Transcript_3736:1769-2122(-)